MKPEKNSSARRAGVGAARAGTSAADAGAPAAIAAVRGAPGVLLDASAATTDAAAVWLEVAYEGSFKGHWMGEFEFTRATFEEIVANFHAHPAFRAGAEQADAATLEAGAYDVVQWDMHHASEAPATSGEIPVIGAPAQGWVLDVRIGQRPDGKACLQALTRWLEPARTYVREKRYRWASVSVVFNAKDPVTNAQVGAVLTSIAVTNQPFLQDLPALAASVQTLEWYPGCPVRGPEEALECIRSCLGLPATAAATDVAAEVAKLRGYAAPGATPPAGVEVDEILGRFRQILSLPVLSTADDVFAELDKLFTALAAPAPQLSAPAGATNEGTTMSQTATTTPAAKSPADDLRDSLAMTLAKSRKCDAKEITNTQILMAVESGANATTDLAALLQALDVGNLAAALGQIDTLKKIKVELDKLLPQYEAAQQEIAKIDEADALEDVGMALASLGLPNDAKTPAFTSLMRDRKANKAEFRREYKIEEARRLARANNAATVATTGGADPTVALVTQREHATQQPASIFDGLRLGSNGAVVRASQDRPGTGQRVDLSKVAGRNDFERAMNWLKSQSGNEKLDLESLHAQAGELLRSARAA